MRIISDRCPWCGEKIDGSKPSNLDKPNGYAIGRGVNWCRSCGNWYGIKPTAAMFLILVLLFIGCILLKAAPMAGIVILAVCIIIPLLMWRKLPKEKYPTGDRTSAPDLPSCKVSIDWDKKYFMLNYRIWSGYIFPISFVDESANNVWCAKIDVSKRKQNQMDALMCFLSEEATREELFKTGNKFVVFYNNEIIGRGIITAEKI